MAKKAGGLNGQTFVVDMPVDTDAVRRARAESDVIMGDIMKKPVSLDTALQERAGEIVSGSISVTFETDPSGNVRRRTRVTKLLVNPSIGVIKINLNFSALDIKTYV